MNKELDHNAVPVGTKILLVVLAVAAIVGLFAVLGPLGAIGFGIFAAISVFNKSPRMDVNSRGDQGDF